MIVQTLHGTDKQDVINSHSSGIRFRSIGVVKGEFRVCVAMQGRGLFGCLVEYSDNLSEKAVEMADGLGLMDL